MNVTDRIDQLRMERGWTEYTLALESDIPQSTISSWFRKGSSPSVESIKKICDAYGITLSQFFLDVKDDTVTITVTPQQYRLLQYSSRLSHLQNETLIAFLATFQNEDT